ncbi:unnamed protein product [Protopolystoma xenopodis]|uniref:Uncharacterized protein n=1 Tax=Protopolystoma xenopodis TaxID=117903 RepID=A0A448X147_9PLAT|nr:unnamed protein product [Protopolystoma xenopodis]
MVAEEDSLDSAIPSKKINYAALEALVGPSSSTITTSINISRSSERNEVIDVDIQSGELHGLNATCNSTFDRDKALMLPGPLLAATLKPASISSPLSATPQSSSSRLKSSSTALNRQTFPTINISSATSASKSPKEEKQKSVKFLLGDEDTSEVNDLPGDGAGMDNQNKHDILPSDVEADNDAEFSSDADYDEWQDGEELW